MKIKYLTLIVGILAIIISSYNTFFGEELLKNVSGFILGIGLILASFKSSKYIKISK